MKLYRIKKSNIDKNGKGLYATKYIKNDWWCYMSGNDVALPNKLKDEISLCESENKKICYSAYNVVDENLNFIRTNQFQDSYSFENVRSV